MAVSSVKLAPRRAGGKNERRQRTYGPEYEVTTDDRHDGPQAILAHLEGNVAAIGGAYSVDGDADAGAFLKSWQVECTSRDGLTWKATANYGPPDDFEDDPLDEPEDVEWDFVAFEETCDQDTDGNAVVNSAGDYFDPPVTRDQHRPILTITRNEASFSAGLADAYRDTRNAATFFGAAVGKVKCASIKGKRLRHPNIAGFYYWVVTYVFEFNRDGWAKVILDQGFRYLDGTTRKAILVDGQPASSPVPLDGSGGVLAVGGTPAFLTFEVYPEADYSAFNFAGA